MSELPSGWRNRTNAVPPELLGVPQAMPLKKVAAAAAAASSQAVQETQPSRGLAQGGGEKPDLASVQKVTTALPSGWGDRTNKLKPVSAQHREKALPVASIIAQPLNPSANPSANPAPLPKPQSFSAKTANIPGLIVATRLHFKEQAVQDLDKETIFKFVEVASKYASDIVIAVNGSPDILAQLKICCNAIGTRFGCRIACLPVTPWGQFVPALNAIVQHALRNGFPLVCIQSLEVFPDQRVVQGLVTHASKDDTLVVGAAFPGQHDFSPGHRVLDGRTTPWNTLAVWNTQKIALTGFSLVAEGLPAQGVAAGVEEVCTISILQKLQPRKCVAKLVMHPLMAQSSAWNVQFQDPKRRQWHAEKMASKVERSTAQLQAAGIDPGIVLHLAHP